MKFYFKTILNFGDKIVLPVKNFLSGTSVCNVKVLCMFSTFLIFESPLEYF